MLISLYIKDFGLIDCIEMEFSSGLNVLTGETGSGKSIVLEALYVSLGGRAQTDLIRNEQDRAIIQSTFDTSKMNNFFEKMTKQGLELEEQDRDTLIMSREINRQGRNICRINGRMVNLSTYKEIASLLVAFHSQHDQQSLILPDQQLMLLDRYGGSKIIDLLDKTKQAYRKWHKNKQWRENIISGSKERLQRIDMIKYQIEEIDTAQLMGEDEEDLAKRRDVLANAERIRMLIEQVLESIYDSSRQGSAAIDLLGTSRNDLDELCHYMPEAKNCFDNINSALYLIEEAARDLATYRENIELDPKALNYIEERLALIERLKRKYGETIDEILDYHKGIVAELEALILLETDNQNIDEVVKENEKEYYGLAESLEKYRLDLAYKLEKTIEEELKDLEMSNVKFKMEVLASTPDASGKNKVEFQISPNPGEPLRPLSKIASGGELSRVMLALKSVLADVDDVGTLVFDEVDAGIGGRTLQAVAEKLEQLGSKRQILCVTHATALAACASKHYLIKKSADGHRTLTSVQLLEDEDRIKELSRMLGGNSKSESLVRHVRNMIKKVE